MGVGQPHLLSAARVRDIDPDCNRTDPATRTTGAQRMRRCVTAAWGYDVPWYQTNSWPRPGVYITRCYWGFAQPVS